MIAPVTDEMELNVLLARPLISLTRAYERADPEAPSLPFCANLLRVLDTDAVDVRALPGRARISKRAVRTLVRAAKQRALVNNDAKLVQLTAHGAALRDRSAATLATAEANWHESGAVRKALQKIIGQFDLEHPHYLAQYGPADLSAIGGRHPGHGQDWKPVRREGPLDDLPLTALLSQALMEFTISYESGQTFALAWTIHALRHIPDAGVAFAHAPVRARLSGDGRSTLERHGAVTVVKGVAKLTGGGKVYRDAYAPNVARVEQEWRDRYGDSTVTAARKALTALNAELEAGLADHPVLTWRDGLHESSG
ncbi:MAG TPA: hypothetical protein VMZ22_13795 [Acidimicrobiales bacterium]|nr:hypothetical protein [Acidimicrobiales bacterium]